MSDKSDVDALTLGHEADDIFSTLPSQLAPISSNWSSRQTHEAITNSSNLLKPFLLQILNALLHNRINRLISMGIISTRSLRQPSHQIEPVRSVQGQWIPVEKIGYEGVVSVLSILISHQSAVLPDSDDIGEEENRSVFVHCLAFGFGDVGFDATDFNGGSCGLTAACVSVWLTSINEGLETYSCLTPTVQHVEGGLDAIFFA